MRSISTTTWHLRLGAAAGGAVLLSSILVLSMAGSRGTVKPPGLMRREPRPSALAAAPVDPVYGPENHKPMMRREAPAAVPATPEARPKEWGSLMRREASVLAVAPVTERPKEWGKMMRREASPVAAAVTERPKEWGKLMRREPRLVVAAAASAAGEGIAAATLPGAKAELGFGHTVAALLSMAALVGFALQVKSFAESSVLRLRSGVGEKAAKGK